jgi:hypothetical protein
MDSLAQRHLGIARRSSTTKSPARAPSADRLRPGRHRPRHRIRRRGRRHHAAPAPGAAPAAGGGAAPGARSTATSRCRCPGAVPHGAQRRADRRALLERRARSSAAHDGARARRRTKWRAALQPQLAQAAPGDPVREARLPVVKKTPTGAAVHRRGSALQLAARLPAAEAAARAPRPAKLKSTYTDKLPRMVNPATGRVHTNFAQAVAVTGRLASSDPNLQNIPVRTPEGRRIREAFIAPPGHEARLGRLLADRAAHHGPPLRRRRACSTPSRAGEDVHRATAAEIFGVAAEVTSEQRRYAKVINFGLIYGMSAFGLARSSASSAARRSLHRPLLRPLPGVAATWSARASPATGATSRRCSAAACGCRRSAPRMVGRRQGAERAAINAPMQGTAADLIKLAMIAVQRWLDSRSRMRRAAHPAGARRTGAGSAGRRTGR